MNDTVVYLLVKIPNTKDDYEDLEKISGVAWEYDYPQKKKEEPKKEEEWSDTWEQVYFMKFM